MTPVITLPIWQITNELLNIVHALRTPQPHLLLVTLKEKKFSLSNVPSPLWNFFVRFPDIIYVNKAIRE